MTIPASHIVKVSPRVISGGSADLETNGLLLTKSALLPADKPAAEFSSAKAVAAFFGAESTEAAFAQQYFSGVQNAFKAVNTLVVGRRIDAPAAAFVRGGAVTAALADFKKITAGTLTISVAGKEVKATGIDLSASTSFSDVAQKVAAKITGTTGSFDTTLQAFTLATTATGKAAAISLPAASTDANDLAAQLGMTTAAGAVVSPGSDALTAAANLDAICAVTANWVGFTTAWEATAEEAEALAAWADIDDDFVYIDWTEDQNACSTLTQADTKPAKLLDRFDCTACFFGGLDLAALALAAGASIAWTRQNGVMTWFAKSATGVEPKVVDESAADALEAVRCSYFGSFATRNARFSLLNPGSLASSHYGFLDVLYGSIWLRNAIQRACMDGFAANARVPYNDQGRALISAWIQDPIETARRSGVIDAGLALSNSQKQQILQEVGQDISQALFTKGYWYGVTMPDANVRAQRGSPEISLYYCYAGSVQKLDVTATTVL